MTTIRRGDLCDLTNGSLLSNDNRSMVYGTMLVTREQAFDALSYGWRILGFVGPMVKVFRTPESRAVRAAQSGARRAVR